MPVNSPPSSYTSFSWTSDYGLTWSATDSCPYQTMTGKNIVVRNGSLTCNGIPNGISSISFKHQQLFSGTGGIFNVYVIGTKVGIANPTNTIANYTLNNINVSGSFNFQIVQAKTGLRIGIDDLSWQNYNAVACIESTAQPTGLSFSTTTNSVSGTFTMATPAADDFLVVMSLFPSLDALALDGTNYSVGSPLGSAIVAGVVSSGSFLDDGLTSNTTCYYFIFSMNDANCGDGPNYLASNPLSGSTDSQTLPICVTPPGTPFAINHTPSGTAISGSFTAAGDVDTYLVVISANSTLSTSTVDGTIYAAGQSFGGGTIVGFRKNTYFTATGLTSVKKLRLEADKLDLANHQLQINQLHIPETNIVYYRLKLVDIDANYRLSKVVRVRLNNNFSNAIVYPNPVSGMLQIKLNGKIATNSKLQIMDFTGMIMKSSVFQAATNVVNQSVSYLPQGRYFVRIYNSEEVINSSFVIIRYLDKPILVKPLRFQKP